MPFNRRTDQEAPAFHLETNHSEGVQYKLYAFLRKLEDLDSTLWPALRAVPIISPHEIGGGSMAAHGILITSDRGEMARLMNAIDNRMQVPAGAGVFIFASWGYYWSGNMNDYETIKTLDNLGNWLEEHNDLVLGGEWKGDVD